MATSPATSPASASKSPKSSSSTAKGRPPKASTKKGKGNDAKTARESSLKMVGYSLFFAILAVAAGIVLLKGVSLHQDYYASRLAAKESTSSSSSSSSSSSEPVTDNTANNSGKIKEAEASKDAAEPPVVEEEETVEIQAEDVLEDSQEVPLPEASKDNEAEPAMPATAHGDETDPGRD